MTFAGIRLGVVLAVAVAAGLALLPIGPDPLRPLRRAGRGSRKWWILAVAAALSLLLGEAAGRSSVSHSFAILVLAVVVVPSLLACGWAWVRARSFS